MDLAARKLEFIDWLIDLKDENKIDKILSLKYVIEKEIVALTISGHPLDKEEYIKRVNEADKRISSGQFTTIEDLEKEIKKW
ncbi:MAG: hypothetical protein H7250_00345 [Flavobacterium sp.]|nr:hypothetical protein [Flavobacterium sp.]